MTLSTAFKNDFYREILSSSLACNTLVAYEKGWGRSEEGRGQKIAVPEGRRLKPVQRLRTWLDESGITRGYVFQTMRRGGS